MACNSELIDPDQGVFSVLGIIALRLVGPYCWIYKDFDEELARGADFHAYEPWDEDEDRLAVASISIADVTNDPTEPDVSELEQTDVPALDDFLQRELRRLLTADGREIIRWMSSQLNQSDGIKGLVTVYITKEQGKERQTNALRTKVKGRKIAIIGVFDTAKKDVLAPLITSILRNMVVLA